jgi:hypothetical protein
VFGDPARPETIAPSLEGVTALFLHPRAVGLAAGELLALARQRGCSGWWPCRRPTSTTPWTSSTPATRGTETKLVPLIVLMPVVLALHDAQPYHHVTDPAQRLDVPGVSSGLDQLLHAQQAQGPTSGWSLNVYLLAWVIVSSA